MKIEVTAYPRTQQGTGASRRLRGSGRAPGIIYGAGKPAQAVELDQRALLRHLKLEAFHASILDITVDSTKEPVLLRDFQMHPWKQMVLHVDFQRVDRSKKIYMSVPLHFINEDKCEAVKLGGGVVQHIVNEIEIQCLPDDLPEFIEVDVTNMQLGHSMHVSELTMPEGVELLPKLKHDDPPIVAVQLPREIAVEEEVAAPVTEIIGEVPAEGEPAEAAEGDKGEKKEPAKKE
jgi:large subunit ribosomal protein L25